MTKIIGKVNHLQNAPIKLLALLNEVADLTVVLRSVEAFLRNQNTRSFNITQDQFQQLSTLVNKAKDEILRLTKLIQYTLMKPDSTLESIKISRREWLKAKPIISEFQQSLRDIRLNITTHMTVVNS